MRSGAVAQWRGGAHLVKALPAARVTFTRHGGYCPDDLSPRCVHRVNTVACLNARNTMTPTKNESSAISTHPSRVNAKDKRSIRFDAFLAGRKDQIGGRNEPNGTANKAWEVVN
jgi:hypothetical protein